MTVSAVNFGSLSINVKDATKYGLSNSDVAKINQDGDEKITYTELQAAGAEKYAGLAKYFNPKSNGALLSFKGNVDGTKQVGATQTNPISPSNFIKNTFAFQQNANPNRPEHRDCTGVDLPGYAKKGQNVYLIA